MSPTEDDIKALVPKINGFLSEHSKWKDARCGEIGRLRYYDGLAWREKLCVLLVEVSPSEVGLQLAVAELIDKTEGFEGVEVDVRCEW